MNQASRGQGSEAEPEASGTPQGVQVLAFLCGLVVAFLGFKSAAQDYHRIDHLGSLDRLTETPAKFLKVGVRKDTAGSGDDYYPDVTYEYFVNGKSIWGWRLSFEEEPQSKAYWEKRLAGYAVGQAVEAYYNPADPKESIVEKKHDGLFRVWLKMLLGICFFAFGALLAVLPALGWLRRGRS